MSAKGSFIHPVSEFSEGFIGLPHDNWTLFAYSVLGQKADQGAKDRKAVCCKVITASAKRKRVE
jgi:hypothetical protein